ncbi:penicillin-binding protein 1A [Candidatus Photodesmus blepharus]|uniref:Penicillin-binding protein 1A n=2 Tax=Candidatus Photodesmus blepharonis TaxID=1179155 RepID=A0A084CMZ0_9GAMM|nr:penicillin-binding protein 1A [Candidatus Photodesmus blepharus]
MTLSICAIFSFYYYERPKLPDVTALRDVTLQTPMQIFSQDGKLLSQFGEKRRIPITYSDIPKYLIEALIATEDSRFYKHFGVDPIGITRAVLVIIRSGSVREGASTITQQLARNFFLSNEKKILRKIKEIFIAMHIEQLLSKKEIMELYVNKIFLGHRSYGFAAAAQTYFGKDLQNLSLSQIATLAGIPKAPSTMNPIYSLERATNRRNLVLLRMLEEKYITQQEYDKARIEIVESRYHQSDIEVDAPYVAELARAWAVELYGESAYTSGMNIYTTIDSKLQKAANQAAIDNLLAYDERHGYRGAEKILWKVGQAAFTQQQIENELKKTPVYGQIAPAIVTTVGSKSAKIWVKNSGEQTIDWAGMSWARKFLTDEIQGPEPKYASDILHEGEKIWVRVKPTTNIQLKKSKVWLLSQIPNANTALVAINPENGAILSLVGGFNFSYNKFNRATQSLRQIGSSVKPFIYSAAIEQGMTLATLINDAPINQWKKNQRVAWRPKNSPEIYSGPTRLRIGLAQSKNVMAVRVLREVGLGKVRQYLTRFGFNIDKLPHSETIALGASSLTPIKMTQAYSVFANGGYYIKPFYISKIEGPNGNLKFKANPKIICRQNCPEISLDNPTIHFAPQVISEQTAFLVREMMYSNIWGGGNWHDNSGWNGTGWRAQNLKRHDIGGKTGTTNRSKDAWYSGYGPNIVTTVWVGFDDYNRSLGQTKRSKKLDEQRISGIETGAKTAQPAWIKFMRIALQNQKTQDKLLPPEIIRVRIDRKSGLLTNKFDANSMFEYFLRGTEPREYTETTNNIYNNSEVEELF